MVWQQLHNSSYGMSMAPKMKTVFILQKLRNIMQGAQPWIYHCRLMQSAYSIPGHSFFFFFEKIAGHFNLLASANIILPLTIWLTRSD